MFDNVVEIFMWVKMNYESIFTVVAYTVFTASLIVKITPTLRDDNWLLGIVKFIGKYIALDKYGPPSRPQ